MNWKPSILKIVISLAIGIIAGLIYMSSKYVSYNAQMAGFILALVPIAIL